MADPVRVFVAALTIVIALMLGTAIVDSLAQNEDGIRFDRDEPVLLGSTGSFTAIDDASGFDETVRNSRGHAVNLTGEDGSFVEAQDSYTIAEDDTWTVATWAFVDSEAETDNMTAVSADGRVVIWYNGTAGNWSAWFFDEGSRDSFRVNVSTSGDEAGNWTAVMAWHNGSHLSIFRNTTQGDVKSTSGDSIADAPVESGNWNGRLDETRTFDDALNSSRRSQFVNSPIDPQKDTNRTSRIMYDEPDSSSQDIFFTDTRLDQHNVTFSSGLAGEEMDKKTLLSDNDYDWDTDGPKIKPMSGGRLDGAPVAYVEYEFESALYDVVGGWADFVGLAILVPIVLIIGAIFARVRM